jgi:DNA-binding YbaB/EbfC family protein
MVFKLLTFNFTSMFDMMKMMGKMKEVQARLKEAQDGLVHLRASGEAGAGMVKAVVNGKKQVVSIEIDPALMKAEDRQVLQDLIVAAVNKASEDAEVMAKEELRKSTEGLLPNIPGMDLSGLMGGA